jgi:hypothetical protein
MIKTKTITNQQKLINLSKQIGIVMLSIGTTLGMLDSPDHARGVVVPSQPAFAYATFSNDRNSPIRRSSEETEQHYVSYSVSQRTPERSGKR